MSSPGFRHLAREPGYLRFLAAATLARTADEMFAVGVVLLAIQRAGSVELAGAIVAAVTFPSLITAPLIGAWLDLHGRRRALMMADALLGTAVIAFIALATGRVPDVLVIAVALLAGLTWPLSFGGFTSFIPVLVPDELLPPANAIEATSFNVALIVGPLIAGGVAAAAGPEAAVLLEAGLTLCTLLLLAGFEKLDSGPVRASGSLLEVARAGLREIATAPVLRGITIAGSVGLIGVGVLAVALPIWCEQHLGAARTASGLLWAAFALGSTLGALAVVRLLRRWPAQRIVIVSLAACGALMLPWLAARSLAAALPLVALAAVCDGPGLAATFQVRQEEAPADLQGQIVTTSAGLKVGCFALGSAIGGPLVAGSGSHTAILVAIVFQLLAAVAGALAIGTQRHTRFA